MQHVVFVSFLKFAIGCNFLSHLKNIHFLICICLWNEPPNFISFRPYKTWIGFGSILKHLMTILSGNRVTRVFNLQDFSTPLSLFWRPQEIQWPLFQTLHQGANVNYSASEISDLTEHFIRENWRLPTDKWGPESRRYRVKGWWALYLKRSWAAGINKSWGLVFGTAKVLAAETWPAETNTGHQSSTHGESLFYEPNSGGGFSLGYPTQDHNPVR